ncbi:hypothetical protein GCM10011348_40840 [Marinobacterium nitratireducens]|uniref:YtkA-like domain-containing protein n=1 Tax=Marinobacterium nitratireducens TaxID=518897 RepID=A0A917ZNZ4_9GAMM|nr:hypothetical protein [Marinobacterium nitratireducens]GGO87501.1 hypothetical protein GCM10011348_40840 [Marinobacterium nitratireducens]
MPLKSIVQWLAIPALILVLIASVWLLPRWLQAPPPADQLRADHCDLGLGPCRVELGAHSLELELAPRQVRALEPLEFRVRTTGMDTQAVSIRLEGKEMYMGINEVQLQPVTSDPGLWRGTGELAICSTGEMVWQARVQVTGQSDSLDVLFEFSAR